MARVFLSHATADAALADTLRDALRAEGHVVFLDHARDGGFQPGVEWERVLYEELERADALLALVTPPYTTSQWCFAEVALAKARGRRVLPVTAVDGARHALLESRQELYYYRDPVDAIARLLAALASLDAGGGAALDPQRGAFPGLRAFDVHDRAVFFGRERESGELAAEVRARVAQRRPRALLVVGASGSGKSSVVRAGLVPRLLDDESWWHVPPFVPGDAPLDALADMLARARKDVGLATEYQRIRDALPNGVGREARAILREVKGDRRHLLLVVDQLEEAFTRASADDGARLLEALDAAVSEPDGAVTVVATLRSEFVADLLRASNTIRLREHPVLLPPLGREHLPDVIAGPARLAGLTFDDVVIRRLVDDTGTGDALPLLAFTLRRLTDGLARGGRVDLARYEAVGGVQQAVASEAERVLLALGIDAARVMEALLAFVTLDDQGRPTRRRRRRTELPEGARPIVDAFVDARLLTADAADGDAVISVAHETLFTAWSRLAEAIRVEASSLQMRRELEREASLWALRGRSASYHWRGERLALAERLATRVTDLGEAEREFIAASRAQADLSATREADILVDRVVHSGVEERDTELTLLYLLASIDEHAHTPSAIAAMRHALAKHRLIGRVGPTDNHILAAEASPDLTRVVIVDLGTNEYVTPSTRLRPVPTREVCVTAWSLGSDAPYAKRLLQGRRSGDVEWSTDGRAVVVSVEDRREALDADTLATVAMPAMLHEDFTEIPTSRGSYWVDVTAPVPNDSPVEIAASEVADAVWMPGPRWSPPDGDQYSKLLALSPDGRTACVDRPRLRLVDLATGASSELEWHSAMAAGFSGDGKRLALASRVSLVVIDLASRAIVATLGVHSDEEGDVYSSVALSHDGTLLVSGSLAGTRSFVWDVATGTRQWSPGGRVVTINPYGSMVAATLHNRTAIRGEGSRPTDAPLEVLDVNAEWSLFSPTGDALLTVTRGNGPIEVSLPDASVAARYFDDLDAIGFTADGRHVIGRRGTTYLRWPDRDSDAVIARARRSVFRQLTAEERANFEMLPLTTPPNDPRA